MDAEYWVGLTTGLLYGAASGALAAYLYYRHRVAWLRAQRALLVAMLEQAEAELASVLASATTLVVPPAGVYLADVLCEVQREREAPRFN